MKRYICMILCMVLLTGCRLQNSVADTSTDNSDSAIETDTTNEVTPSSAQGEIPLPLQAYIAVLENKEPLYASYSKEEKYLNELITGEESIAKYTLIDLNDDGAPEVVLQLSYGTNEYYAFSVLHYSDGIVYHYGFPYRGFNCLKIDGSYHWSNSAFNNGIAKIDFNKDIYTETNLAYCEVDTKENYSYYIGNESVSHAEFSAFQAEHEQKQSAEWYDYTIDDFKHAATLY